MKNVNVRVKTEDGWRWREVPEPLWRRALLRAFFQRNGGQPAWISPKGAGPWSMETKAEKLRRAEAREYLGFHETV